MNNIQGIRALDFEAFQALLKDRRGRRGRQKRALSVLIGHNGVVLSRWEKCGTCSISAEKQAPDALRRGLLMTLVFDSLENDRRGSQEFTPH